MSEQFEPILADTLEFSSDEDLALLEFPVLASPKLDGIRAMVIDGQIVSRNLKPIKNKVINAACSKEIYNGFDGELIVGEISGKEVFKRTSSGVMSADGSPDYGFYVFDVIPEYGKLRDTTPFHERYMKAAIRIVDNADNNRIRIVKHELIDSIEQLKLYEDKMVKDGFEGIMIRSLAGLYKYGRSTINEGYLLKVKRFIEAEAVIVGFKEEFKNTNEKKKNALGKSERSTHKANKVAKGTLGALILDYNGARVDCGTGFSKKLRQEIWNDQESWMGKVVTIKFFEYGDYEVPRFPVFKGIRHVEDMDAKKEATA